MTHESKTPNTHASVVDLEKGIEWLPEIDLELSEDAIESVRCELINKKKCQQRYTAKSYVK